MTITQPTQRQIVLQAMAKRPHDHWARGIGHVPLGIPGSPRTQKAYHEPGGDFSPSPGSFGVSLWARAEDDRVTATSSAIPLDQIRQRYAWDNPAAIPAIETNTPYYECRWSLAREDVWQATIVPATKSRLDILIRSVGPAGGPVESIERDGLRLIVNHRWVIETDQPSLSVHLGTEDVDGWPTTAGSPDSCASAEGWCYARIEVTANAPLRLTIRDTSAHFSSPLAYDAVTSGLELDLPDPLFSDSLNAQVANLMMGFVGKQTCPGEPTNYPLAWERDGAYAVLAMARCGRIETAKDLALYFAENDFFGGFGAEGDAPGSTINAVASVALISRDAAFQRAVWPHVERKLRFIDEMVGAKAPIRKPWLGPIVPEHRSKPDIPVICQPASDGLVVGSMDLHYPVLYINAITFRGLVQAAALARRLGKSAEAEACAAKARSVRDAYLRNFSKKQYDNERTFMSALWPSWMVERGFEPFRSLLASRWEQIHKNGTYPDRPLWTYFTAAEAHQWLYLDRPDHVWKTMRYFWDNQCSPGLYTYWEGNGEENAFGLWEHIRGWIRPPHITPHYWTAGEMLLLQLDMLTYVDESRPEPELVIGAGIPKEWLRQPIRVAGMPTSVGKVDWEYEGTKARITLHGTKDIKVRLGAHFGKETSVEIR